MRKSQMVLPWSFNAGYDDAKFTQTVPGVLFQSGDRIPQVPRASAEFDADYHFPISNDVSGFANADYRYVGNSWSTNNAMTNPTTGALQFRSSDPPTILRIFEAA